MTLGFGIITVFLIIVYIVNNYLESRRERRAESREMVALKERLNQQEAIVKNNRS